MKTNLNDLELYHTDDIEEYHKQITDAKQWLENFKKELRKEQRKQLKVLSKLYPNVLKPFVYIEEILGE